MIFNFLNVYDVIVYQFIWNIATNVTYKRFDLSRRFSYMLVKDGGLNE